MHGHLVRATSLTACLQPTSYNETAFLELHVFVQIGELSLTPSNYNWVKVDGRWRRTPPMSTDTKLVVLELHPKTKTQSPKYCLSGPGNKKNPSYTLVVLFVKLVVREIHPYTL